jgi:hypothetical protein
MGLSCLPSLTVALRDGATIRFRRAGEGGGDGSGRHARRGVRTLPLGRAPFGDGVTVVAGVTQTTLRLVAALVAAVRTARRAPMASAMGAI